MTYLAGAQRKLGHDVHLAYLYEGPASDAVRKSDLRLHRLHGCGNYDPRLLLQLRGLADRVKPDIVQSWILQMDIVCGLLARASTWRWVLREPVSATYYARSWKASLRRWVGSGAAALVANSKEGEGYWTDVIPQARRFVIPNGVPEHAIKSAPDVELESFGVPESCPCLLFVGRLERQKNVERLLLAISKMSNLPIWLLICGDGSQRPILEAKARHLGVSARVVCAGYQAPEIVWGLMKRACGLALISEYEGFPNVLLEAMVCGCPIVVSDIKEHREWLGPLEALWVGPSDIAGIARALRSLVEDREETMTRAARARIKAAEYTVTRMAEAYEKVYQVAHAA